MALITSNVVGQFRRSRGWSQAALAERVGISRTAVSAIEKMHLVPSVATAIALANAFGCSVETIFAPTASSTESKWAFLPCEGPCRYVQSKVGHQIVNYPVEDTSMCGMAHDGVFQGGRYSSRSDADAERTLVMASCDPAASLLTAEFARTSCFRLLILPRSSSLALQMLAQGLIHCAGIHFASGSSPTSNHRAAASTLGSGFQLLHVAQWQAGLAMAPGTRVSTVNGAVKSRTLRWIGREVGSAARQCLDELRENRPAPRRMARSHRGVAEAIRLGWADAGICHRLVAAESRLHFLPVRNESFDLCFASSDGKDPRIEALIRLLRTPAWRRMFGDLPGMDTRQAGAVTTVS